MRLIQNGFANNFGLVGKSLRRYLATTALTATSVAALASPAFADNWTDHVADEGSISIDTSIPNTTNITQHTDFTKVHGDGDINAGWTVNVAQPSNSSKYVLYDVENDPTEIMGTLNANGQVYIFDKNGVIFGQGSQVNVGGIIATTGNIADEDIKANKLVFKNVSANGEAGSIVNNGTITVADAGLAAFVAPTVTNNGMIAAQMGTVVLASGEQVTIDLYGDNLVEIAADGALEQALIENKGTIQAAGGTVVMSASAAKGAVENVINMDGVIDVSSVSTKGGKIILSGGNKGVVKVSGDMNASGKTGGGSIRVTGQNVDVDSTSDTNSDAVTSGDGGSVLFYGRDYAIFNGRVSARGGAEEGDGGEVEISGGESVGYYGFTDTSAANGTTGTLLIDPKILTISNNLTFGVLADIISGGNSFVNVNAQALADTLALSNVNLWATEQLYTEAGIDLSTWSIFGGLVRGITTHNLTLASPVINILGDIILGMGSLNIYDMAPGTSVLGFGILDVPASGVEVNLVNLNGEILTRNTVDGATTKAGDSHIHSQANFVQVLSDNASVQQAVYFANDAGGGVVTVAPGYYNESITIDKQLSIYGAQAGVNPNNADTIRHPGIMEPESVIAPNSPGFHITADGVLVDGFFIMGADNGIHVDHSNNVGLYNNIVYQSTMNGIWVDNSHSATVAGNRVVEAAGHGIFMDYSNNGTVIYNAAHQTGGKGIFSTHGTNMNISYNGVNDAGSDGIMLEWGYGKINGNIVDDVDRGIVSLRNTSIEIKDNVVGHTSSTGIDARISNNINIDGNHVDFTGADAIHVDTAHHNVKINNNRIGQKAGSQIKGDGIYLAQARGGFIQGNKISNTVTPFPMGVDYDDGSGIYVYHTKDVTIGGASASLGNKITNVAWDGIKIAGSSENTKAQYNDIDNTKRIGIYSEGSSQTTALNNKVHDSNLDGWGNITILGGKNHTANYNTVWNDNDSVGDHGIFFKDVKGHNEINDNKVHNFRNDGIHVQNVTLTGGSMEIDNNDVWNVDNGIWVKNAKDLVITDNDVDGRTGSGKGSFGIYVEDSYNAQIGGNNDGNDVEDFKTGIRVIDSASADVENNDVSEFVDYGIWASDSNSIDVKKNDVYDGSGTGIRVYSSNDAEINDNDIWDVGGHGIELVDSHNVDIFGNEITEAGKHGIFVDPSDYVDVAHNTIHYVGWDGIHVLNGNYVDIWDNHVGYTGGDGIDVVNNDYAEIWDNTVHDAGDNGIEVSDSYKVAIIDNDITDSDGDGIEVTDSNYADISWNDIFDSGDDGIDVHSSNNVDIVGNDIDGTRYNGIEVTDSNYVDIYKNHVTDAGLDGINVHGGIYADIARNHIYGQDGLFGVGANGADRDGIHVENNYGVDITDNKVTGGDGVFLGVGGAGAGRNGIYVRNSDWADIRGNEVTAGSPGLLALGGAGAKDDGIDVRNSKYVDIVKNWISGVLGDGIQVRNSKYVDVIANHVHFAGDDGIDVENSAYADINHNHVYKVVNNGIEVENSYDADVIGNRVELTGDDGIFVRNSDRADIRYNRVKLTGDDGIDVRNSDHVDIVGNNIRRTHGDGIQVRDSKFLEVDGNRVRFAGDDGIDVENTFWSSITDNNVRFSDNNGIELEDSSFVTIDGNTSNDNGDAGIFVDPSAFITVSKNTLEDNKYGIHFDAVYWGYVLGNTITDNKIGLFVDGPHNGYIEVSDNTFTDNKIGALFKSGLIDLTGPGNRFYNGKIAMYFEAWGGNTLKLRLVDDDGIPGYQTWPTTSTPTNFGGTIGEQYFEGQDVAFVYLGRNTFIDPKTREAIWLDGSNSTYYFPAEGGAFTPSIDGLTVDRLAFLEDMFHHRPDASRRGIFWFGELPDDSLFSVAQEDLFNKFDPFNGDLTGLNVRITGLPNIPGAPGAAPGAAFNNIQTFAGGARTTTTASSTDPSALNAIETAAGGPATTGGTTQTAAQAAASVEPAAGGDNANCWSDAASIAGGGQSVNVVYGGSFADNLNQAAACGTSF